PWTNCAGLADGRAGMTLSSGNAEMRVPAFQSQRRMISLTTVVCNAGAILRLDHRVGNLPHAGCKVVTESRFDLLAVRFCITSRQNDAMSQSRSALGNSAETPFKSKCCPIQRHLNCERMAWSNISNPPRQRFLPWQERFPTRAFRK